jgi:propanol-preferring alcohol dehydrogenase
MKAMVLHGQGQPLVMEDWPLPEYGPDELLIKVRACAVCRTDLHVCDGDLTEPKLPLIPGHEIVGKVIELGTDVSDIQVGDRVGVPWLGHTCGICDYCKSGRENLCDSARFTGYQIDGGYADYTVAHQRFVFPLKHSMTDIDVAPLLCAGLIGYRSLVMAGDARRLGIYGFGAAAHIVAQVAVGQGQEVYAFTREGDKEAQAFATRLGASWVGGSKEIPPMLLDAAIIYAPVGQLIPAALKSIKKGGIVVCAGIHMSDIPAFPYEILWGERRIQSVANLTRDDGVAFLKLTETIPVNTETKVFPLVDANIALNRLRKGNLQGAAVLVMDH